MHKHTGLKSHCRGSLVGVAYTQTHTDTDLCVCVYKCVCLGLAVLSWTRASFRPSPVQRGGPIWPPIVPVFCGAAAQSWAWALCTLPFLSVLRNLLPRLVCSSIFVPFLPYTLVFLTVFFYFCASTETRAVRRLSRAYRPQNQILASSALWHKHPTQRCWPDGTCGPVPQQAPPLLSDSHGNPCKPASSEHHGERHHPGGAVAGLHPGVHARGWRSADPACHPHHTLRQHAQ